MKGGRIQGWGTGPLEPGVVKDGLIMDAPGLGSAVAGLLRPRARKGGRIIMALNGLRITTRVLSFPRMRRSMYEEAIRREAKREMPLPEEELCLSWQAIEPGEREQRFFVVGVARNLLQTQIEALKQLGISPRLMEPKAVALARAVNRKEALIMDLEPEGFEIILAVDGIPLVTHRGPWRQGSTAPEDMVQHLMHELSRALKFYSSAYPDNHLDPETPAFLTGELAVDPAISGLCRSKVGYTIEPLEPPLDCPPDLPLSEYAVNLGLALKEMTPARGMGRDRFPLSGLNVQLVDSSRSRPRILKESLAVAAIAGAVLLLVPVDQANSQFVSETGRMRAEVASAAEELNLRKIESKKAEAISQALSETTAMVEG
ncbi:MAG: type IV pilus biogenesis protein PilM, partial [Dehalococcoidia bacterium]